MSVYNQNDLLLTEDGHPIGQVIIADNTSTPPRISDEEREDENRRELTRIAAQEITGEVDADTAVMELYPSYTDEELRKKAMSMFVVKHDSIDAISKELSVPARTVARWAYDFKWEDLVKKELVIQHSLSVLDLTRLRNARRLQVAKEQMDQAQIIRNRALTMIENNKVSIKTGAEAWAAAAKIEHTLTGMSEAGTVVSADGKQDDKKDKETNGKTPLVMVFQGGLPPVRKATTV